MPTRDHTPPIFLRRPEAGDRVRHERSARFVLKVANDFTEAEHSHRDRDETDAVGECRQVEGVALHAGVHISAD